MRVHTHASQVGFITFLVSPIFKSRTAAFPGQSISMTLSGSSPIPTPCVKQSLIFTLRCSTVWTLTWPNEMLVETLAAMETTPFMVVGARARREAGDGLKPEASPTSKAAAIMMCRSARECNVACNHGLPKGEKFASLGRSSSLQISLQDLRLSLESLYSFVTASAEHCAQRAPPPISLQRAVRRNPPVTAVYRPMISTACSRPRPSFAGASLS